MPSVLTMFHPSGLRPTGMVEGADYRVATVSAAPPWGFPEWFVISQTAIPALLFLPGSQCLRLPIRIAAFAVSLLGLLWWFPGLRCRRVALHPAQPGLVVALLYLCLMLLHPATNNLMAGLGQIALYAAVLAPIFWAPTLVHGPVHLARLLALLLIGNGINALVGVLQVYAPCVWLPAEFSHLVTASRYGLEAVSYLGADGQPVIRPPGLFDSPGAVCAPAMAAVLFGLIFCLGRHQLWQKLPALLLALAGMAAIYLSHVRTALLIVAGMLLVYVAVLAILQRQRVKAACVIGLSVALLGGAFVLAVGLGGASIRDRFLTLLESDPMELFYASRGRQLQSGLDELLVEFPVGAGLGRWGMMHAYFGDTWNKKSSYIWAEVQPNAWILDGGLVLLSLYGCSLAATMIHNLRLARYADLQTRFWAAAIIAANAGTLALLFSFTPFLSQTGLQFWFLAGALHGAARHPRCNAPAQAPFGPGRVLWRKEAQPVC